MIEKLLEFDKKAFVAINSGMENSFFDWLCPILRTQEIWYPFYAIVIYFLIKKYKKDSIKIILAAVLLIVASDQFSSNLIKNTFMRIRPCSEPTLVGHVRHLVESCRGYSFISAHATNHFAIALFFAFYFKNTSKYISPIAIFWASSIAFSQVYVGVHYPLDVLVGALVGVLFGFAFAKYSSNFVNVAVNS